MVPVSAFLGCGLMFIGLHLLAGDPVARENHQTPQQYQQRMHELGLDLPLPLQFGRLMVRILSGDLAARLRPEALLTAEEGALAAVLALPVGVGIGLLAAARANSRIDRALVAASLLAGSLPNFLWAALLVVVGVTVLYNLTGGLIYYSPGPCCHGTQILMPAFALGAPFVGYIARHTRAGLLEVMHREYIATARAKGLREPVVVRVHALRNTLISVVTVLAPIVTAMITGSLVVEQAFGVPGLGRELILAILSRNYDVAVGVFVYYVLLIGIANFLVDLVYPVLDPRIRLA
jgi:ABC-type dipeptide/oligopeptide/nickel transport system permease component